MRCFQFGCNRFKLNDRETREDECTDVIVLKLCFEVTINSGLFNNKVR